MKIAIVGATGKVGRMMLTCLSEFNIKYQTLDLYATVNSAGREIDFENKKYIVKALSKEAMEYGYDYILFSAGGAVAKEFAPFAAEVGSVVIDNSSAFRQEVNIPLIVPEINCNLIRNYEGIIANPNCSTIQLVLLLKPINEYKKIKKIVVTTMQSVSGAGYKGISEMQSQRAGALANNIFPKQIDLNVIPQIGNMSENDYCEEENKMAFETRKILNDPSINISVTTVRVPVVYGHSESVYIEFYDEVVISDIINILSGSEAVCYQKDYITPLEIGESNLSYVSRIRYAGDKKSILLWNVAHNVRLGAATNAVKILMKCIEK